MLSLGCEEIGQRRSLETFPSLPGSDALKEETISSVSTGTDAGWLRKKVRLSQNTFA